MTTPELEPPDKARCQAEKSNGQNAFTLGGGYRMVRCSNVPIYILTENKPGADGQIGSMSICVECLPHFLKQYGADYATLTPIQS